MNTPTDTDLLNAIERHGWEVDAPEPGETATWVIYDANNGLGAGLGCAHSLGDALTIAWRKTK